MLAEHRTIQAIRANPLTTGGRTSAITPETIVAPWGNRPSCLDLDPETWFPSSVKDDYELPKRICRRCPAIRECAEHALKSGATDGIWAGITLSGPSSIARQRRKLQAIVDAPESTPSKEN